MKNRRIAILLLSLAMSGCTGRDGSTAETTIEGVILRVRLEHMHPFLAEYRRFLEVERVGKIEKKEIFPDTGGYAWVVVAATGGNLEVKDIGGIQFTGPLATGAKTTREYLGRFDFDAKKVYRFIPASSDPREPQPPK